MQSPEGRPRSPDAHEPRPVGDCTVVFDDSKWEVHALDAAGEQAARVYPADAAETLKVQAAMREQHPDKTVVVMGAGSFEWQGRTQPVPLVDVIPPLEFTREAACTRLGRLEPEASGTHILYINPDTHTRILARSDTGLDTPNPRLRTDNMATLVGLPNNPLDIGDERTHPVPPVSTRNTNRDSHHGMLDILVVCGASGGRTRALWLRDGEGVPPHHSPAHRLSITSDFQTPPSPEARPVAALLVDAERMRADRIDPERPDLDQVLGSILTRETIDLQDHLNGNGYRLIRERCTSLPGSAPVFAQEEELHLLKWEQVLTSAADWCRRDPAGAGGWEAPWNLNQAVPA